MTPHNAHLTRAARLALRIPGIWAWRFVLRAYIATKTCRGHSA
jgi:hypothetical protein